MAAVDAVDELSGVIDRLVAGDRGGLAEGETLVRLHAQLQRLDAVVTEAVGRFDAAGAWAADGARTAAAWLATRWRIPAEAARRRVGLARALRSMPVVAAAWLAGRISAAHLPLLRQAQRTGPAAFARDEAMLVDQAARLQHRHLAAAVGYWCQLNEPDDAEAQAAADRDRRSAHLSPGLRGTGLLNATFDPVGFDIFQRALRRIEDDLFKADWADTQARLGDTFTTRDLPRTAAQRRCDALIDMARRAMAAPAGARLPEPLFTVHLGADALARLCELANGTVITPGGLVPWIDQAWVERVVHDAPDRVTNLSHRQRLFTNGTRRAVEVRHRECYHPYCDAPAEDCEIDHIQPYAQGGPTTDTNGRPACAFHNRLRNTTPDPPEPEAPHPEPELPEPVAADPEPEVQEPDPSEPGVREPEPPEPEAPEPDMPEPEASLPETRGREAPEAAPPEPDTPEPEPAEPEPPEPEVPAPEPPEREPPESEALASDAPALEPPEPEEDEPP